MHKVLYRCNSQQHKYPKPILQISSRYVAIPKCKLKSNNKNINEECDTETTVSELCDIYAPHNRIIEMINQPFSTNIANFAPKSNSKYEYIDSPYTGVIVSKARYLTVPEIRSKLDTASSVQKNWCQEPLHRRIQIVEQFLAAIERHQQDIAISISLEVGKPITQALGELATLNRRVRAMMDIAPVALGDLIIEQSLPLTSKSALSSSNKSTNGNIDKFDTIETPKNLFHYCPNALNSSSDSLTSNLKMATYSHKDFGDGKYGFERRVMYEPVGIVAVIAPWNYPLLTSLSALIPGVLAGNSVVVKPSPRSVSSAGWIERCFHEAGAPQGLVQTLFVGNEDFSSTVITHPEVNYISFTGSPQAGRQVYKSVAESRFMNVGLELGGKDSLYVAEDADLNTAIGNIVEGALYNSGQTCCAVERVLVHHSRYTEIVERLEEEVRLFSIVGNPLDEKTTIGPMALPASINHINNLVADAIEHGAQLVLGGSQVKNRDIKAPKHARFYHPTLLTNVSPRMDIFHKEVFGPVITVIPVEDDDEAIKLTNNSKYGLTSAIITQDPVRAAQYALKVTAGVVFMNRSDYIDPYLLWSGGNTDSGIGASMGEFGFANVTKPKGIHFRQAL